MPHEYLKLSSLAKRYDLHKETMKRKLKELDIKLGEHYIVMGKTVLFHAEKCHKLLISQSEAKQADDILSRLLV
jgi:hypothetical protein